MEILSSSKTCLCLPSFFGDSSRLQLEEVAKKAISARNMFVPQHQQPDEKGVQTSDEVGYYGDVISYDSDDEMVRSRGKSAHLRGQGSRNKKGHPIYSREDIREQYCINRKELQVFEDGAYRETRLFGCLSTSNLPDNSPCSRDSFFLSCVQKRKSTNGFRDQKLDSKRLGSKERRTDAEKVEDDEDSDGGFRRRPKPRTCLLAEQRYTWTSVPESTVCSQETLDSGLYGNEGGGLLSGGQLRPGHGYYCPRYGVVSSTCRTRVHTSFSLGSQQSADSDLTLHSKSIVRQAHRPCQLHFDASRDAPVFGTSHSVDELNGKGKSEEWYQRSQVRAVKTPDLLNSEEGRPKHVSFDSSTLVRSNTIGGGLESDPQILPYEEGVRAEAGSALASAPGTGSVPAPAPSPGGSVYSRTTSPPDTSSHSQPRNQSQERLIMGVGSQAGERSIASVRSLDLAASQSQPSVQSTHSFYAPFYSNTPSCRLMRRAVMKTQATQTEVVGVTTRLTRSIPAYLTLSPRATSQLHARRSERATRASSSLYYHRHHRSPFSDTPSLPLTASRGRSKASDESEEDEVLEVHLREHKARKPHRSAHSKERHKEGAAEGEEKPTKHRTRSRVKGHKNGVTSSADGEIMVIFKPSDENLHKSLPGKDGYEYDSHPLFGQKSHSVGKLEQMKVMTSDQEDEDGEEGIDRVQIRRHSVAADFCDERETPLFYPPPGFDDNAIEAEPVLEGSPEKSSTETESSRAVYSGLTDGDQQSTTGCASEIDELESSLQSHESPTLVSDLSYPFPESMSTTNNMDTVVAQPMIDLKSSSEPSAVTSLSRPLFVVDPLQATAAHKKLTRIVPGSGLIGPEILTSPDSETSSHLTELVSSTSSSGRNEKEEEKESGSSVYVTATEHSLRDSSSRGKERAEEGQTSFDTASSATASLFSSPSSSGKRKSSSSGADEQGTISPDVVPETHSLKGSAISPTRSSQHVTHPSAPKPGRMSFYEESRSESSEDSSTAKRERPGSPGSESGASKSTEQNIEEFDSEGMGDSTPVHEMCSSDPSTAFEPSTIVENLSPKSSQATSGQKHMQTIDLLQEVGDSILSRVEPQPESDTVQSIEPDVALEEPTASHTVKETPDSVSLLSEPGANTEDTSQADEQSDDVDVEEEEPVDSDDPEAFAGDKDLALAGGSLFCRRTLSGELSTVSEVSEEMSNNHKSEISLSSSSNDRPELPFNGKTAEEEREPCLQAETEEPLADTTPHQSGNSSPSIAESTTSGSFVIDGQVSETHSMTEESRPQSSTIEKTGSLPCLPTEGSVRIKGTVSEGTHPSLKRLTESNKTRSSDKMSADRKDEVVAGQVDTTGDTSQATERDMARSEFSLEQQSSQEIDEESFSFGGQSTSHTRQEYSGDAESGSTTTPVQCSKQWPSKSGISLVQIHQTSFSQPSSSTPVTSLSKDIDTGEEEEVGKLEVVEPKVSVASIDSTSSGSSSKTRGEEDNRHALIQRRARSLSRSPEKAAHEESEAVALSRCHHHQFTCSHCGESAQHNLPSILKKPRDTSLPPRPGLPYPYRKSATIDDIRPDGKDAEEDIGVYSDTYRSELWFYIGRKDELLVWGQKLILREGDLSNGSKPLTRSESMESTSSEKGFRKQYEAVTHRMIHRKASIEMYRRVLNKTFVVEKNVIINRNNGEFGFRIHGSRPVVVSAIERGTPAETCGLEVGDIIVSINDVQVLDASHSEVVRLAHAGPETLKLELVRTRNTLDMWEEVKEPDCILSGFLSRRSNSLFASSSIKKEQLGAKIWRKRWYLLKTDYCLYWYKSPKETEPLGVFRLQNCCASMAGELKEATHCFRLLKHGNPSQYLSAKDDETAIKWVNALNEAINRLIRLDPYLEATLRNIHVNPLSIKDTDSSGYLGKFSQRCKVWRQRYFVLKDACLYFFMDVTASTALGVLYLQGYKVQSCSMVAKKNTFELIPPQAKLKHFWFVADSEVDKKRWLAALEYSIDRWIKLT